MDVAHFVAKNRYTITFSQLRDRYYQPSLLERLLGVRDEPLPKPLRKNNFVLMPPKVTSSIDKKSTKLRVNVVNRKGGIGKVEIKLNGILVLGIHGRGHSIEENASRGTLEYDFKDEPKLKPGDKNTVEVVVFNEDNTIASAPSIVHFVAP